MRLVIELKDQVARDALAHLARELSPPTAILRGIGEFLRDSAQERIGAGGPAPDGTAWAPLTPLTLKLKKNPDRGILRDEGHLQESIAWQLDGDDTVAIGSRMVYARIHQFGGTIKPKPGSGKKALRVPGVGPRASVRIPARPYLGVSQADQEVLEKKVVGWLKRLLK